MTVDMIYGLLVHLGRNMWTDAEATDHLRCGMKVWNDITEHIVACEQLAGAHGIVRHLRSRP